MIRPFEGPSPALDVMPPAPSTMDVKPFETEPVRAVPTAIDGASVVKASRAGKASPTFSLTAKPPETDLRKLINDADDNVLMMTDTYPTDAMIKLLASAVKRGVKVEVCFDIKPDMTKQEFDTHNDVVNKLEAAGVTITWGNAHPGVHGAPKFDSDGTKLWTNYK